MEICAVLFQCMLNEMELKVRLYTALVRLHSNTTDEISVQVFVLFILPACWMVGLFTLRPDLKFIVWSLMVFSTFM